jgi:hypothetical protein
VNTVEDEDCERCPKVKQMLTLVLKLSANQVGDILRRTEEF